MPDIALKRGTSANQAFSIAVKFFPFVRADEILHSQYNSILDLLKEDIKIQIASNQIYSEPYFFA